MPKIDLPKRIKCWRCGGIGYFYRWIAGPNGIGHEREKISCDCDDGLRYDLGALYTAVDNIGAILTTLLMPTEGEPDYVAEILCAESRVEARGDTHEDAAVNAIKKWNEVEK